MKKLLFLLAAMMFVPALPGCSGGGETEIGEENPDETAEDVLGTSEDDYEAAMQENEKEATGGN